MIVEAPLLDAVCAASILDFWGLGLNNYDGIQYDGDGTLTGYVRPVRAF